METKRIIIGFWESAPNYSRRMFPHKWLMFERLPSDPREPGDAVFTGAIEKDMNSQTHSERILNYGGRVLTNPDALISNDHYLGRYKAPSLCCSFQVRFADQLVFCPVCQICTIRRHEGLGQCEDQAWFSKFDQLPANAAIFGSSERCRCCALIGQRRRFLEKQRLAAERLDAIESAKRQRAFEAQKKAEEKAREKAKAEKLKLRRAAYLLGRFRRLQREEKARRVLMKQAPDFMTVCNQAKQLAAHLTKA